MISVFLSASPVNFNIYKIALETERAIWENRQAAGLDYGAHNFRIHEGDIIQIIQVLERNDLIVTPKEALKLLYDSYNKHNPTPADETNTPPQAPAPEPGS